MRISDWSSDVCSSDLVVGQVSDYHIGGIEKLVGDEAVGHEPRARDTLMIDRQPGNVRDVRLGVLSLGRHDRGHCPFGQLRAVQEQMEVAMLVCITEIGRASCRDRVCQYV